MQLLEGYIVEKDRTPVLHEFPDPSPLTVRVKDFAEALTRLPPTNKLSRHGVPTTLDPEYVVEELHRIMPSENGDTEQDLVIGKPVFAMASVLIRAFERTRVIGTAPTYQVVSYNKDDYNWDTVIATMHGVPDSDVPATVVYTLRASTLTDDVILSREIDHNVRFDNGYSGEPLAAVAVPVDLRTTEAFLYLAGTMFDQPLSI